MEHCLRLAFLMVSLIWLVQAKPFNMFDLRLERLTREVSCNDSVTFQSPTNVREPCFNAALKTIKDGLEHAKNNCTGNLDRLDATLDELDEVKNITQKTQSSDCKWERKTFPIFVNDFKHFAQLVNSL